MTSTTPVAKLTAALPKANGLTRAVPQLFHRRGDLVPFVGMLRIEEAGLDADDNQHLRASIARFEIADGHLAADAKDLMTMCSTVATSHPGQGSLFPPQGNDDEDRRELLGFIAEWGEEQDPPLDMPAITELWNSWHGGHYDARLDEAPVRYLREFAFVKGVLADDVLSTVPNAPDAPDVTASEQPDEPEGEDGEAVA